ncbi:LOW QUALITY PROTEIN: uncharacterized protein LOC125305921 [Alosa alosa]|uniref:LOW QUALITY PROTEIN: uncharacterized protein LOC125305921 n=1 Tax=Alosa alosa TaxID=278164 RepID=UPI0020151B26|nr:LOW QUALITY PROTEIN: uncharacterized protein LOC125305921 [Alosa alosa]
MSLTISTINVRSVKTLVRAQSILSLLSTLNADIFLLQECSLPFLKNYSKWEQMWTPGPSIWSGSNFNKADWVAILIKNPHVLVKGSTVVRPGRALLTHLTILDRDFNVLNVYGFNDKHDRHDLLIELQPHMLGRAPLVVGGDFNCVLSRQDRKKVGEDFNFDKTSGVLNNIIKDFNLVDCYRKVHPREEGFTWHSGDGARASRIDYVLTRDCPPTDATLTPLFFSDHCMLSCTLSLPTGVTVGGGLWRLNCSLLQDEEIVREYREQFSLWQTLQDFYDTRAQWWEMVKGKTKTFFKTKGVERAVFYFMWGSKWERLRREVLKKRPENGGMGLPDPHLFLGAHFTALHIRYATAPSRDSKTAALDREAVSPVPGLTLSEAQQAWRNAAHPALQNKLKDLAWMALHEVLPVRAVMHSRGMARTNTCPRPGCGQPETVRHLLWECGVARDLWADTGPLQCPSLPAGEVPTSYRLVVSGVGQGATTIPAADFAALWLTLNSTKAALWTSRNLLVGKRVTVPLPALRRLVTSTRQEAPHVAIRRRGPGSQTEGSRPPRLLAPAEAPPPLPSRDGAAGGGEDLHWAHPRLPRFF